MYIILVGILLLIIFRILFYRLTLKEKVINVNHKFKVNLNGNEILKIFDENKIEYIINEDIMISKKRSNDLWDKLSEGVSYKIKYYGLNITELDFNYKIISVKQHIIKKN